MSTNIDIVITWVDGNDLQWRKLKNSYIKNDFRDSQAETRYRDCGTLKYVFRSIEQNAPWVRKVYLVTCGQIPSWLKTDHPKIELVNHADYIPKEFLPTFSSHTIEMNFHRIDSLSEQFVYFNDDMFLTSPTVPEDFFVNGLPCESAVLTPIIGSIPGHPFVHYLLNNIEVINGHFQFRNIIRSSPTKWYNLRYGKHLLKNILYSFHSNCFVGFQNFHMPAPHLKSTFAKLWECEPDILKKTCENKSRGLNDVNPYLASYYNFCENRFMPASPKRGKYYDLNSDFKELYRTYEQQKHKFITINDSDFLENFESARTSLEELLLKMYPQKSSFENG